MTAFRRWSTAVIFVALAFARPALHAARSQQAATGTIEGTVTRAGSTEPIPGVQISVSVTPQAADAEAPRDARATSAAPALTAVTDGAGRFSLSAPIGNAVIHGQLDGYFGPSLGGVSSPNATATTMVRANQSSHVALTLVPGATINGRVTDPTGKPVASTAVGVVRRIYRSGVPSLDLVDGKETDDRGEFRIFRLPPGEYFVVALQGHGNAPTTPDPVAVTTFYPCAADISTALPVQLKGGEDLAGIDIQVRSEFTHTVSGRVTTNLPPGSEIGAINRAVRQNVAIVAAVPREGTMIPDLVSGNIMAKPDGTFEIHGLLPGSYDVIARLPASVGWGPQNGPDRATNPWALGRTAVEVGGADVEGVVVSVHQGVDVKGRVSIDGKPQPAAIRFTLLPDDNVALYNQYFSTISNYAPFLDADGAFTLPLIPESHYRFRVGLGSGPTRAPVPNAQGQLPPTPVPLPAGAYVADVQQSGRSVYDEGLAVGTDPIAPIDVILKSDGGTVKGIVSGADQKPAAGRTVVLVPEAARRRNSALFRVAVSDDDGSFTIARVPPGTYSLFAWDAIATGAYENPQFLAPYESRGTPAKIAGSATLTINLTSIR